MFAQKTPVSALTLPLNDSWNSFYFQDLTNFKNQLLEDYQLRFLILNYLNKRRYWLRRFTIKKNNGYYFIGVAAVAAQPKLRYFPLIQTNITKLFNNEFESKELSNIMNNTNTTNINNINKIEMKENKLSHLKTKFQIIKETKQKIINIQQTVLPFILLKNKMQFQQNKNLININTMSQSNQKVQLVPQQQLAHQIYPKPYMNILLKYKLRQLQKLKKTVGRTFIKELRNLKIKKTILNNGLNQQMNFSINHSINNIEKKTLISQNFKFKKVQSNIISIVSHNKIISPSTIMKVYYKKQLPMKVKRLMYKPKQWMLYMFPLVKKFFMKRYHRTWTAIFVKWLTKWGPTLRFRRNAVRRFSDFSQIKLAMERLTSASCFISFRLSHWRMADYKALKSHVLFERHRYQKFFLPLMAATHYSLSQGVPSVLVDYLRNLLWIEKKHMPAIRAVDSAIRYWLCSYQSTRILPHVLCQGVKFEIIGKLDGSDRTRMWRTLLGAIPTSSFNSNIRYEQASIFTIYGNLHIHLWLYYTNDLIDQPNLIKSFKSLNNYIK